MEKFLEKGPEDDELFKLDDGHFIEGSIDDRIIVSIPETTSHGAAEELQNRIQAATARPVLIVTHNVQFLRSVKLSGGDAAKVIARSEMKISNDPENSISGSDKEGTEEPSSDGGGSGDSEDGSSGIIT